MNKPLVSICIPTYNGEKYLSEALDSVLAQTYEKLEVIISDDQSIDNTLHIIKTYQKKTSVPFLIFNHKPSCIGANWNNCVRQAKGKYIKFLFQDDVLYPACISEMVSLAEKDSAIGLVFSNRDVITTENGKEEWVYKYGKLVKSWTSLKRIQDGVDLLSQRKFLHAPNNKIGEPSVVLLRHDCFERVGYFSEKLNQSLDYEYWYRVMSKYKIGYIDKPLAAFRLHPAQATRINKKNKSFLIEKFQYLKSIKKNLWQYLSPTCKAKLLCQIGIFYISSTAAGFLNKMKY